jgi:SAM-dependent methyltransferase
MSGHVRWYNWLIHSAIEPSLRSRAQRYARGRLLDIGCGTKPYRPLLAAHVSEHVGLDRGPCRSGSGELDLAATAYAIPLRDASFDTVLCSDVLEHLEEPRAALAEAFRVLKPRGYAIYTAPLFWHLHEEPRDFFRYTRHGLDHLFSTCGFEVVEITALTGFAVTFAQQLAYALCRLRRGGRWNPLWWLVPPVVQLVQALGFVLHRIDRSESFTAEYLVVARRPGTHDAVA